MTLECLAPDSAGVQSAGKASDRRKKKLADRRKSNKKVLLGIKDGVVTLTATEYARFEQCMNNPEPPTETLLRGAKLLESLKPQA